MKNLIFVVSLFLAGLLIVSCQNNQTKVPAKEVVKGVTHPAWSKNAVIYEVNIRQYSPEGTFAAFEKDLPRLKELGVDILWLMPIYPIGKKNRKGTMGSPYAVRDYKAVNPDYGTMDEFKNLVKKAHNMGFKVILDWVANHTAWDNDLFTEHKDWYTLDSVENPGPPAGTDWADVIDLNYDNQGLRNYMTDAMKYWLKTTNVDGFRCDVASMVPTYFWDSTRVVLDSVKPVFMLAEAEEPELQKKAFDMSYAWEFHHVMNEIAQNKQNLKDIGQYIKRNNSRFSANDYRMYFTSNHDENTWNGTAYERLGNDVRDFAVITYAMPGMPLIYNGQEAGLNKRLLFFDKDSINWNQDTTLEEFYAKLNLLKHRNKALFNGSAGGSFKMLKNSAPEKVATILRTKGENKVLFVVNFSDEPQKIKLLNSEINTEFRELFSNQVQKLNKNIEIELTPHAYEVFYK